MKNIKKKPRLLADAAIASGAGMLMVAAVLMCCGAGYLLDRKLDTSPVFMAAGVIVGFIAAVLELYRMMTKGYKR